MPWKVIEACSPFLLLGPTLIDIRQIMASDFKQVRQTLWQSLFYEKHRFHWNQACEKQKTLSGDDVVWTCDSLCAYMLHHCYHSMVYHLSNVSWLKVCNCKPRDCSCLSLTAVLQSTLLKLIWTFINILYSKLTHCQRVGFTAVFLCFFPPNNFEQFSAHVFWERKKYWWWWWWCATCVKFLNHLTCTINQLS